MGFLMYGVAFICFCQSVTSSNPNNGEPYLRVVAKSTVYDVGEKKAIYCEGFNLPERLDWYDQNMQRIEDRDLRKSTRIKVERPRNNNNVTNALVGLIIESTEIADSGNWTCKAGELEQVIKIQVGEKVRFKSKEATVVAEEYKIAKLECEARGYPKPVVQWYKDNIAIEESKKYRMKTSKEDTYVLEIRSLDYTDSGEYMCKLTQEELSHYESKIIKLMVQHKPVLRKEYVNEVYAILNETKNITCSAIANPPPIYKWYRRHSNNFDEPIVEEDTIFTSEDSEYSVMLLRMYNESALGEYKCTAENNRGTTSIVFHVTLGNKPDPPDFVNLTSSNATHLTFNVTCSTCKMEDEEGEGTNPADLKILGFSFEFVPFKDGYPVPDWDQATELSADIVDPEDSSFAVGPLDNSTTYWARVRSRNLAGFSEWVVITPNPATTDGNLRIAASALLVLTSYFFVGIFNI